jgi:hypothetical protein
VPGPFQYLGYAETGYPSFVDEGTGRMLVAEPGGSYAMRAVEEGIAVPPADGRWAPAAPPPAPAKPPVVISSNPVPPAGKDGD